MLTTKDEKHSTPPHRRNGSFFRMSAVGWLLLAKRSTMSSYDTCSFAVHTNYTSQSDRSMRVTNTCHIFIWWNIVPLKWSWFTLNLDWSMAAIHQPLSLSWLQSCLIGNFIVQLVLLNVSCISWISRRQSTSLFTTDNSPWFHILFWGVKLLIRILLVHLRVIF